MYAPTVSATAPAVMPRMAWPCLYSLVLFVLSLPAMAAGVDAGAVSPATPLDLEEAVRLASRHVPLLQASDARIAAAEADGHRAGQLPDPVLMLGMANLPVTGAEAFDTNVDPMTMHRIGITQVFPSRGKRDAEHALAQRRLDQTRADAFGDRVTVQRETALAWVDAWSRQREIAALQALRDQARLAAGLARARLAGGTAAASDVLAIEVQVLDLDGRLAEAAAARGAADAVLQRWTGVAGARVSDAPPDFSVVQFSVAELPALAERLPELRIAGARLETAAARVDMARASRRPDWSVSASYGDRSGGRSDMLMLEVGIGLPVFKRHRQDRDIAARQAEYEADLALRDDVRQRVLADLQALYARWQGLQRAAALREDTQIPLADDRVATALAAYRAGGPLAAWLDAQDDALALRLRHVQQLNALGRAWAALSYLTGEEQP